MLTDNVSQPIRVALVDDHRTVLWGLQKLIESAGPRMTVVASATCRAELLATLDKDPIDLVLLDVDLGTENGLDLIAEIRQRGAKVVILSGLRDADIQERAMLAGACGFLSKMEPADVILRAIDCVHRGEIWLNRQMTAKVMASFTERGNIEAARNDEVALTSAERKVIAAVTKYKALPNKAIADLLHISPHTLRNQLAAIYDKLGVHKRMDLVFYALDSGFDMDLSESRSAVQRYARRGATARAPVPAD